MKLTTIVAAAFIGVAATCFSGCMQYEHTDNAPGGKEITTNTREISANSISISEVYNVNGDNDVAGLIRASEKYIAFLDFKGRYNSHTNNLMGYLGKHKWQEAHDLTKYLVDVLEGDQNEFAQDYLNKLKRFTYRKKIAGKYNIHYRGWLREDVFGEQKKTKVVSTYSIFEFSPFTGWGKERYTTTKNQTEQIERFRAF